MNLAIHTVGLFVLSQETGTEEQNNEFIAEFRKQFPAYVIKGNDEECYEDAIVTELNRLDKENKIANKQIHKWVLIVPDTLPMWAEDGAREETEYVFIYLKDLNNEEEKEEFTDMCSEFFNCQGVYFWDKKQETMAEFVSSIMK